MHNGKELKVNEKIEEGCIEKCICEASGKMMCVPRCPAVNHTSDQCVTVRDPKDMCCEIELCDVTLDDHEQSPIVVVPPPTTEKDINDESKFHCEYKDNKYTVGKYPRNKNYFLPRFYIILFTYFKRSTIPRWM